MSPTQYRGRESSEAKAVVRANASFPRKAQLQVRVGMHSSRGGGWTSGTRRSAGVGATTVRDKIDGVGDHIGVRVVEDRGELAADTLLGLKRRLDSYRRLADPGPGWEQGVPRDWLVRGPVGGLGGI